ncbi:unnamed protein product [Kuraishia capsulata CBS 1993]|uniref:Translocon Sec61/SecY plug domain-containing protein n=1 Tax=Kuraishia capsulata CBS 1993 TaxID=1382522 RepID=W6MJ11_9ASCO|nr:uncharacterized protein KUCA_T00000354001 [Kuraishia capsulata CBS 1993]CDK24392.1 unnamed protein product [Kuraishia capsulata CBS 1993]
MASVYPIKLAYCGALPLVFTYALLFNLNIFGFTLVQIFKSVPQTAYVGVWEIDPFTGLAQNLSGGVLYFLSSSSSGSSALAALARPFTFGVFIVLVSVLFARVWTGISGSSGRDLAKQFKEQDIALIGHRDVAVTRELNKIIPVAAATGAAIIGLVVAISENLGSRGESVSAVIGLLSALTILEGVATEWQQTGGQNSQIGQAFGQQ